MRCHVIVTTHTTRHLAGTFAGLSRQTVKPDTITLTVDNDDESIGQLFAEWSPRLTESTLRWVRRPHQDKARPSQVRNNGVRALREADELADDDCIVFLDGDMVLSDTAIAQHIESAERGCAYTIARRACLNEHQTQHFDAERYAEDGVMVKVDRSEWEALDRLQAKNERHVRWKRWPWVKERNPKLIGCHHSVRAETMIRVNGFDEEYFNWGREDCDFSLRMNMLRPRVKIGIEVNRIHGIHLWHPGRQKMQAEVDRFRRKDIPIRPDHGLETPLEQPTPTVSIIGD